MQKQLESPTKEILALPPKMKELGYKMGLPKDVDNFQAPDPSKKVIRFPVAKLGSNPFVPNTIYAYPEKGDLISEASYSELKDDKGNVLKDVALVTIKTKGGEKFEMLHMGEDVLVKHYTASGKCDFKEMWPYSAPKESK